MSFEAEWLALREPADRAARDPALLAAAVQVAEGGWVLDLGCGTGSTARAFASVGGRVAGWRLFDGDARLLAEAVARTPGAEGVEGDLADLPALPLEGIGLVTASALLDLVSHAWIEGLAARLAEAGVGFYAALSVDGRMAWTPHFHRMRRSPRPSRGIRRGTRGWASRSARWRRTPPPRPLRDAAFR